MKRALRNKQFDFFLSLIGFIFSALLLICELVSFMLEQSEKVKAVEGVSLSGQSANDNDQVFLRLVLITTCFLFSALICGFAQKNLFRLINFIFLTVIIVQSYVLSNDGLLGIQFGKTQYADNGEYRLIVIGVAILGYIGFFMMLPAVFIIIIQTRRLFREKSNSYLTL